MRTRTYVVGYACCLALTLTAYFAVTQKAFPAQVTVAVITGLALTQLLVQLIFFLHLDRGASRGRFLAILAFALIVVLILVFGSLWIMGHFNYPLSADQITNYVRQQEAIPQ